MKYHRQLNYRKRRRFILRMRLFFACLFLALLVGGAYGYLLIMKSINSDDQASAVSKPVTNVIESTNKVFVKQQYQFQTDKTWTEIPAESTASKHVYRSRNGNLIEHELIVHVNQIPDKLASTRVLPVSVEDGSRLSPLDVSEHCVKAAGGSRIDTPVVKLGNTSFRCAADSTMYSVLVGQVGGSTSIPLKRPDGTTVTITIQYTNVRAVSDASQINSIAGSFQAR